MPSYVTNPTLKPHEMPYLHPSRLRRLRAAWEQMRKRAYEEDIPCHSTWRLLAAFAKDMGPPPRHHELRLRDPAAGYMPWNCHWARKE